MALSVANEIAAKSRLLNLTAKTAETVAVTKRTISIAFTSNILYKTAHHYYLIIKYLNGLRLLAFKLLTVAISIIPPLSRGKIRIITRKSVRLQHF